MTWNDIYFFSCTGVFNFIDIFSSVESHDQNASPASLGGVDPDPAVPRCPGHAVDPQSTPVPTLHRVSLPSGEIPG